MSRAAPALTRVKNQTIFEIKAILRNGEQLMVTLLLPLLALFLLTQTSAVDIDTGLFTKLEFMLPGIMAMAIMSAAFVSQAIATAFDRRNGVLRFLATTPLGRSGMLSAKVLGVLGVEVIQLSVIGAVAVAMGWRPSISGAFLALVVALLGTAAFTAMALLMAGTMRAEGVLALANILLVLLIAGGGILVPSAQLPGALEHLARILPSGALGDAMRSALTMGTIPLGSIVVLVVWTVILGWAAQRFFKWH